MKFLSSLLEALGLVATIVGAALFDYRAGLIALGVWLVLIGLALDPPERRTE